MKTQLKQFLQQMIIFQALFAFIVIAPTAQAHAKSPFTQQWLNEFNYSWTLESTIDNLKEKFTTKQDHKDLDSAYEQFKNDKSKWSFQLDEKGLSYWQNNEKKFIFNNYDKNSVTINGQKISMSKGVSFKKFHTDFAKAMKQKDYSLNSLFIEEADAFFWLLAVAAVAGVALLATSASAKAKNCPVPRVDFAYTATSAKFKNKRLCNDMPRNYDKRIKLVANQYKPNMKFNTKTNTSYRYDESCVSKFSGLGRPQAVQLCKCIHKKQQRCAPNNSSAGSHLYGWNMKYPMAEQTCMTAFQYWKNPCTTPPPTTTDTPTPTTNCGKTGTCKTDDPPPVYNDTPTPQPDNNKTEY